MKVNKIFRSFLIYYHIYFTPIGNPEISYTYTTPNDMKRFLLLIQLIPPLIFLKFNLHLKKKKKSLRVPPQIF